LGLHLEACSTSNVSTNFSLGNWGTALNSRAVNE